VSTNTLILIVALVFLAVATLLGVLVLRGRPGRQVDAALESSSFRISFKVSQQARERVDGHLREAVAKTRQQGGLDEAQQRLAHARRVHFARVLWVDDHPDNNIEENLMLTALGASVTQTLSTGAARRYLDEVPFDLLISDLGRAGDQDAGFRLLAYVAELPNAPRAIVYTLNAGDRAARAREIGAAAVAETPGQLLAAFSSTWSPGLRNGHESA